jgi:hypothetical protein
MGTYNGFKYEEAFKKFIDRPRVWNKKKKLARSNQNLERFKEHPQLADPALLKCGFNYNALSDKDQYKLVQEIDRLSQMDPLFDQLFRFYGLKFRSY